MTTDELGGMVKTIYDDAGRAIASINPLNKTTTTVYDAVNRVIATINPLNKTTTTTYDAAGQVIAVTDPLSHTVTSVYDPAGRLVETINAMNSVSTQVYDAANRRIVQIDENNRRTTYTYDNINRLVSTLNADNGRTTTVYDAANRVITEINENGVSTSKTYDNVDRLLTVTNCMSQKTTYSYDDAGRQIKRIDPKTQTTTYTYDKVGRLLNRQYADTTAVTLTYDENGNRLTMSDTTGTYTSVYDDLDRLSSFTNPDSKQIQYDYDAASQRIEMIDPDSGVTTYDYDDAGRMISLDNPQSESTAMEYDDAGREIKTELDNGTENTTDYNAANQVVGAATSDGSSISSYNYGVDGLGNMTSLVDHLGRITNWKYDPTNQLTVDNYLPATGGVAEKSWASLTLFQWDQFTLAQWNTLPLDPTSFVAGSSRLAYSPVGNRSVRIDSDSGTPTTFTYNCGNQVLEAEDPSGVTTYTYDANGNRLTIEEPSLDITTNTWDCENRLVMVEHPDGSVIEYRYNGDGHRVEQLLDSVSEKKWIYDGNTMLMETDGTGTPETVYTYKPGGYGRMVSQRQGTDSSFAHFDGVKNLRMLTDDTGMVTDEYDFDAFGTEMSTSGSTLNAHRWKGESLAYYREPDAAPSLQYALHFRNYDPLTGTFPSRDPAEDDSNLYRYVKNNPLNASDPSGLQPPFPETFPVRGIGGHTRYQKVPENASSIDTASVVEEVESLISRYQSGPSSGELSDSEFARLQQLSEIYQYSKYIEDTKSRENARPTIRAITNEELAIIDKMEVDDISRKVLIGRATDEEKDRLHQYHLQENSWSRYTANRILGPGGTLEQVVHSAGAGVGSAKGANPISRAAGANHRLSLQTPRSSNIQHGSPTKPGPPSNATKTPKDNSPSIVAPVKGKLKIDPAGTFSVSERNAAQHMADLGNDVTLRAPTGTRAAGGTSDLLVNGVRYDVYTPTSTNPSRIIGAIAKKSSQVQGGGVVLDLSQTTVTRAQLGDVLKRVQGAGASGVKDIVIIGGN